MSTDATADDHEAVVPIYKAFAQPLPEHLDSPDNQAAEELAQLDQHLNELVALAKKNGAAATAKRAIEYRKTYLDLQKRALKEKSSGKAEPSKALTKLFEEIVKCDDEVSAELAVPVREAAVTKALTIFKGRKNPSAKKVADFEKRVQQIAKEDSPKLRNQMYFQLERSIIQADMIGREADHPGSTWQDQVDLALQDARPLGLTAKVGKGLRGVKAALVSKVTGASEEAVTAEEFLTFKAAFENSSKKRIDDLAFSVPDASLSKFTGKANDCVAEIAKDLFDPRNKPADRQALGKLLMQAQTRALQQLTALKMKFPASPTPQVLVQDGKLVVMKAAPKVESLVLQGGGGKGAGYPPMLDEMKKTGMLDDVNLLVGTSIGALNASCLACGGLADEREILDLEVFEQAFDGQNFKKQYPDVSFEHPTPWIENPKKKLLKKISNALPSCAGQMAKMDRLTSASVAENTKAYSEKDLADTLVEKLGKLDDATLERLGLAGADAAVIAKEVKKLAKKVKNQDFGSSDRTTQMITFKDLAILHQLDPVNFKELTITGWEGTGADGRLVYFNAKEFGEMPVALAARISMGLPVLSPLFWKGRGPFFDGGLGSNAPVEAAPGLDEFYQGKDPADAEEQLRGEAPLEVQQAMAKTMLMTFDDQGKSGQNLHGDGRKTTTVDLGANATLVKTNVQPKYADTLASDAAKVYNGGVNALEVYHGDLGTLSLGPLSSPEAVEYAENMARMKGLEQLMAKRMDPAATFACTNADEALQTLTTDEKRRLVAAGRPEGTDPLVLELFQKCEQFLAIQDAFDGGDAGGFLDALAGSPLCASAAGAVQTLKGLHAAQTNGAADGIDAAVGSAQQAIGACPACVRSMLKEAVLIPLQQRRRELAKVGGKAPTFLWQQRFSAAAFDNSLQTAASAKVLLYLKEAKAAHEAFKHYEMRNEELGGAAKPKERCEAGRTALTALEALLLKLRAMGDAPSYAAVPTLLDYLRWLAGEAGAQADRLRSVARGKDARFAAGPFVAWERKDWEKKRKAAVESGAMEDPGSSAFEEQMEFAVQARAAWEQAPAALKEKTAATAWKAWDKLIRLAKALQGMTEQPDLHRCLEECVTQATQERTKYPQA